MEENQEPREVSGELLEYGKLLWQNDEELSKIKVG